MDINTKLFELYVTHLNAFKSVMENSSIDLKGPFLSSPGNAYSEAKVKLVFVGQETNGWPSSFDVKNQMEEYSDFGLGVKYYSSPFWNVIRKIEKAFTGTTYCSAWLNLNKFDENNKPPKPATLKILEQLDFILKEEIEILNPDIVVLFTGPKYDFRISATFNQEFQEVTGFSKPQLAEIHQKKWPTKIFRTYHPNYLRRSGLESKVIEAIRLNANL